MRTFGQLSFSCFLIPEKKLFSPDFAILSSIESLMLVVSFFFFLPRTQMQQCFLVSLETSMG